MVWQQVYNPFGNMIVSTALAAIPVVVMLVCLGLLHVKAHYAAGLGLLSAVVIAVFAFGMPADMAGKAAFLGGITGLLPIGWIVLNIIFLQQLTQQNGSFQILQDSIAGITEDRRLQLLLIAFAFGAFFEGAAGFGTPVAVTAAILIGLGFSPLAASGLSLIANTAPVAFGAIGTPILTLGAVTGISAKTLGMMAGRQLPFVSLIVPAWLVVTMSGWRGLRSVWPAVLVCGGTFAVVQFAWSNLVGPELVDIAGGLTSIAALAAFCRVWRPRDAWEDAQVAAPVISEPAHGIHARAPHGVARAWIPWVFLSIAVIIWGLAPVKAFLNQGVLAPAYKVPMVHRMVFRDYPVVTARVDPGLIADERYRNERAEPAMFTVNWASATGTAILLAALLSALHLQVSAAQLFAVARSTLIRMRYPLATIMLMMALGFVTRYGGTDATLGLAFTRTGWLYPFFATLLGWLGVALTGSDTSSNVLFGSLQKITAQQLGFNPVLICTANSTGGVMGKMIDAQSIVVATASTGQTGQEGRILRFVFWHSVALAAIMGVIVMLQAYVFPWMVPGG